MSDVSLTEAYGISTAMGFTGLLMAVFQTDVLSQTEITILAGVLLFGGVFGIGGSMIVDYRTTSSPDLGVTADE